MRRRDFITLLGGAAAWPVAAHAQQTMPVVGYLTSSAPNQIVPPAFREGLAAAGFVEGQNVTIEPRFANNRGARLEQFAAELVQRQVAVIVVPGPDPAVFVAQAATSTIPIVFRFASDPIKRGLITSLARPGGNMTGVIGLANELMTKRLQLLCEMAPEARTIAYLTDPRIPLSEELTNEMLTAANALGREAIVLEARSGSDIDAAFATLVERGGQAVVVGPAVLLQNNRKKIVELAAQYNIPTIFPNRGYMFVGGLMSYGVAPDPLLRLMGSLYVASILRGAKPADLPVQQPTAFDFVINLKTAKALGLTVPPALLVFANEVVE